MGRLRSFRDCLFSPLFRILRRLYERALSPRPGDEESRDAAPLQNCRYSARAGQLQLFGAFLVWRRRSRRLLRHRVGEEQLFLESQTLSRSHSGGGRNREARVDGAPACEPPEVKGQAIPKEVIEKFT